MATPTIDPRVLQALAAGQDIGQYGYMPQTYQPGEWQGGDAGQWVNTGPAQTHLIQALNSRQANVFDDKGNYLGMNSGDSDNMALAKFVAAALAMYGGAQALGGASGGAAGGAGADVAASGLPGEVVTGGAGDAVGGALANGGGAITSLTPAEIAAANAEAVAGLGPQVSALGNINLAGMGAAGGAAGSALGTTGVNGFRQGEIANYATDGRMASPAVPATGGGLLDWFKKNPGLVGALLGGASSGDQSMTTSASKEPWGPAQPLLKGLIDQTGQLNDYYRQNPTNAIQQQYAGQKKGLLDALNTQVLPSLLSGLNTMSAGYQRPGGPPARPSGMDYGSNGLLAAMKGGGGIDWAALNPYKRG